MAKIIVEILGGVLQSVTSDTPGQEVMVIDYGNIAAGDAAPTAFEPIPVEPNKVPEIDGARG
jgi:hypothetical protein